MSAIDKFIKRVKENTKKESDPWMEHIPARVGNKSDVVSTGTFGMIWVQTLDDGQEMEVYNNVAEPKAGLVVTIGRRKDQPSLWQVILQRNLWATPGATGVPYHHEQHELMGPDEIAVNRKMMTYFTVRVLDAATFKVRVYGGIFHGTSGLVYVPSQILDLSGHVNTIGANFVSIEVDETGSLSPQDGDDFGSPYVASAANVPAPGAGKYLLTYVLMFAGQTELLDEHIAPSPMQLVSQKPTVRGEPALIIAASDASDRSKAIADYVCDGTADEQEVITALAALPAGGGKIVFSEGTFNFTHSYSSSVAVGFDNSFVTFEGQGAATIINVTEDIFAFGLLGGASDDWYYPDAQARVAFDGISFTAWTARTGGAVRAIGAVSNLFIRNCYFRNLSKGIQFQKHAHAVNIVNNYSEGNRSFIFIVDSTAKCHDFLVFGNKEVGMEVAGKDGTPVYFINQTDGEMFEWRILGNGIEHIYDNTNSSVAIRLKAGTNADVTIADNNIEETDYGVLYVGNFTFSGQILSNPLITNNTYRDVKNSIQIEGTANGKISDNIFINFTANTSNQAIIANNYTSGTIYIRQNYMTGYAAGKDYVTSGTTGGTLDHTEGSGTVTSVGTGTGLTGGPITGSGTIALADTAVTPGTYTAATITVDQQGRITAASSNSLSTSGGAGQVVGVARWASGGGTTFELPDIAEYLLDASDDGSEVDPLVYSLSADHSQLVFDSAITAGHVVTSKYIVTQV